VSVVIVVVLALAAVALGAPDWDRARQFLVGSQAGTGSAIAVAVLLYWLVIVVVAVGVMTVWIRHVVIPPVVGTRAARAVLCLGLGAALLVAGALHQASSRYVMCCAGSSHHEQEARRLAQ